jgi:hypothetical protein
VFLIVPDPEPVAGCRVTLDPPFVHDTYLTAVPLTVAFIATVL